MAADDDVVHAQRQHSVFDGGGDATVHLPVGRHHVADVAGDEQVAGGTLGDQLGNDARIRAGDEHRPRPLAIGELLEQRLLLGKDLPAEMLESIDNPFQCIVSAFLLWRIGLNAPHTVWHGSEPR